MMAYTVETVSMEKVVACMQQYSTDCADGDVPYDTEDGVISWMNKVALLFIISSWTHLDCEFEMHEYLRQIQNHLLLHCEANGI